MSRRALPLRLVGCKHQTKAMVGSHSSRRQWMRRHTHMHVHTPVPLPRLGNKKMTLPDSFLDTCKTNPLNHQKGGTSTRSLAERRWYLRVDGMTPLFFIVKNRVCYTVLDVTKFRPRLETQFYNTVDGIKHLPLPPPKPGTSHTYCVTVGSFIFIEILVTGAHSRGSMVHQESQIDACDRHHERSQTFLPRQTCTS